MVSSEFENNSEAANSPRPETRPLIFKKIETFSATENAPRVTTITMCTLENPTNPNNRDIMWIYSPETHKGLNGEDAITNINEITRIPLAHIAEATGLDFAAHIANRNPMISYEEAKIIANNENTVILEEVSNEGIEHLKKTSIQLANKEYHDYQTSHHASLARQAGEDMKKHAGLFKVNNTNHEASLRPKDFS